MYETHMKGESKCENVVLLFEARHLVKYKMVPGNNSR